MLDVPEPLDVTVKAERENQVWNQGRLIPAGVISYLGSGCRYLENTIASRLSGHRAKGMSF